MLLSLCMVASVGSLLKLLILPLGAFAFLLFLLLLGAFGLAVALTVISVFSWVFRLLTGRHRPQMRRPTWPSSEGRD